MLSGKFSTHHYASKNSCNYKRPSSFRTLYYVLFSPSFIDFMLRVSHFEHLSWKSQCKRTFRRSTGSAGPQRHCETLRSHLSSTLIPILTMGETHNTGIAGEFWSIAEHMEGEECETWTPAIPHPPSRPGEHSAGSQRCNFTHYLFCRSDLAQDPAYL